MKSWNSKYRFVILLFAVFYLMAAGAPSSAQPPFDTDATGAKITPRPLTDNVTDERQILVRLRENLIRIQKDGQVQAAGLNAFKLMLSTHGNLLLSPGARIEEIEKAWVDHRVAMDKLTAILEALERKQRDTRNLLRQTGELFSLNEKQILEIDTLTPDISDTEAAIERLEGVIRILSSKITVLEEMDALYTERIDELSKIRSTFSSLSNTFEIQMKPKILNLMFPTWMGVFKTAKPAAKVSRLPLQASMAAMTSRKSQDTRASRIKSNRSGFEDFSDFSDRGSEKETAILFHSLSIRNNSVIHNPITPVRAHDVSQ